jgi:SAM-dependent methyltransferase
MSLRNFEVPNPDSSHSRNPSYSTPPTTFQTMTDPAPSNPANTLSLSESRSKLAAHFSALPPSTHGAGWSRLWDTGDFLPFDRGCPNPAFADTLVQKPAILGPSIQEGGKRKRALVPGCGRGYDVLLLASFGYDAYGLEISETAVKRCREEQEKAEKEGRYPAKDEKVGRGKITFINGDFFDGGTWTDREAGRGEWDLIYDYTVC